MSPHTSLWGWKVPGQTWEVRFLPHPPSPGETSLTIHLAHGTHIVTGVLEADKAIALGFACALVTDHLSLKEGRETAEGSCQDVIVHLIAQIPTEDPEVIWIRRRGQSQSILKCSSIPSVCPEPSVNNCPYPGSGEPCVRQPPQRQSSQVTA